jgi:ABC-type glycerol-3-phosphate transport system permease component
MRQTAAPLSRRPSLRLKSILLHVTIIFFCLIVVLPIAWVLLLLFT